MILLVSVVLVGGCAEPREAEVPGAESTAEEYSVPPSGVWEVRVPAGKDALLELSGLTRFEGRWLTVSDDPGYADIYELKAAGEGVMIAEPFMKFDEVDGLDATDFEGIAVCRGKLYMVEEGTYSVVEVEADGRAAVHRVKLEAVHAKKGEVTKTAGAGLEGIACPEAGPKAGDEQEGVIYVVQERQPRMIYVLEEETFEAVDYFDVQAEAAEWTLADGAEIPPDFSDLYFEGGFLYAIERSSRRVLKIDPREKRVVARVALDYQETDYYDYEGSFGMAEGLYLTRENIFVVLDNSGASRVGEPGNRAALFMEFARPAGF